MKSSSSTNNANPQLLLSSNNNNNNNNNSSGGNGGFVVPFKTASYNGAGDACFFQGGGVCGGGGSNHHHATSAGGMDGFLNHHHHHQNNHLNHQSYRSVTRRSSGILPAEFMVNPILFSSSHHHNNNTANGGNTDGGGGCLDNTTGKRKHESLCDVLRTAEEVMEMAFIPRGSGSSFKRSRFCQEQDQEDSSVSGGAAAGLLLDDSWCSLSPLQVQGKPTTTRSTCTTNDCLMMLTPTPIKQDSIQVVKDVQFGSLWKPNEPLATDLLKFLLPMNTTTTTTTTSAVAGKQEQEDHHSHEDDTFLLHQEGLIPYESADNMMMMSSISSLDADDFMNEPCKTASSNFDLDEEASLVTPKKKHQQQQHQQQERLSSESPSTATMGASACYKEEQWNERYQELVEYTKANGHCLVKHQWSKNRPLAQWVKRQRYQYKLKCDGRRSTLTDERLKLLNDLNFVWSTQRAIWEEKYNELVEYADIHGHCNVPSNYDANRPLAIWVRCQRRQYKLFVQRRQEREEKGLSPIDADDANESITQERIMKLKQLGFSFNPRNLKLRK